MNDVPPTILVIIGISGDLAQRKLLPAISTIAEAGALPKDFHMIGITRRDLRVDDVLPKNASHWLRETLKLRQMDLTEEGAYRELATYLNELATPETQRLFYLSIPPQAAEPVIEHLGKAGFGKHHNTKLLLEKPFGFDLTSAEDMAKKLLAHFKEEQLYRIDHYLAKEMAQNLVVLRGGNSLLKRTWNKDFIESIEIVAYEKIDIEDRATFYEQTGALRDVLQNHLLQFAALTLMDLPPWNDWRLSKYRLKALEQLKSPQDLSKQVFRAQYDGYREAVDNSRSTTETFVRVALTSEDPQWAGVAITLATGKALDEPITEIRIRYRQAGAHEANSLIFKFRPYEGAELDLWVKRPGYERELQRLPLAFAYHQHFEGLPEAYERVFVDALRSDRSLFVTSDEVLAAWKVVDPTLHAWEMDSDDLKFYKKGAKPEEIK